MEYHFLTCKGTDLGFLPFLIAKHFARLMHGNYSGLVHGNHSYSSECVHVTECVMIFGGINLFLCYNIEVLLSAVYIYL